MSRTAALRRMLEQFRAKSLGRVVTPAEGAEARRKLAAMIERAHAAAEGGDQVAVYRLSGIFAGLARAVRERPAPDEPLAQELDAIAAAYRAACTLPDLDVRDSLAEAAP